MALPNLSQISEALDKIMPELTPVPVGTVAYAHEVPTGWLQCNGAEVSRTTYARLFRKIGTKYGAGNGSTTFNLPDLQHRVLEGTNTTSEVAQKVEAGLPDITGTAGDVHVGTNSEFRPLGYRNGKQAARLRRSTPTTSILTTVRELRTYAHRQASRWKFIGESNAIYGGSRKCLVSA